MYVFSYQSPTEQELLSHFLGLTRDDLRNGKGFYTSFQGDIISLSVNYQFRIKKFYIAPKLGFSLIRSRSFQVGLNEAYFNNEGRTIGGKIGYDIRVSSLNGWNFGVDFGYKLNSRVQFFIDLEDIRNKNGGGFNYYEAKTAGVGIKYTFK